MAGPQTVFISTLRFVNKRFEHPVKASLGFITSDFNRNVIVTITLKFEPDDKYLFSMTQGSGKTAIWIGAILLLMAYLSLLLFNAPYIINAAEDRKKTAPRRTTGAKVMEPSVTPRRISPIGMINARIPNMEHHFFRLSLITRRSTMLPSIKLYKANGIPWL